ncbi:Bug family tripartite tricarboxylate transporter substrate binding protein [Limnohabitans sp.]|uniref:Bug family tripartite tricarboxylate transporter substrate binding protein n=1 Tax=Limnohabitans sp. TaxID=1907725 RepID=UPI0038BC9FEE
MRLFTHTCLLAAALLLGWTSALADYPDKPIRLIVPQAPGSATDTAARILASELSLQLGQTIVVENRPGGGFTIGLDLVAKAAPDGYTLGMGPVGSLAISPNMMAKLPYDIEKDFQPVALVTRGHMLLAVSPNLPVNSVAELIAYAKKNPDKLTNASSSNGSPGHVGGELFKLMTGTQIVHVPYKGGALAINDLMSGQVDVLLESLNSIAPHARSGKVKALGVSGARRSPGFPNIPTIAEAGVPGFDAPTWTGVIAPAGLPKPVLDKLNAATNRAIASSSFKERFGVIGDEPAGGTPEEFGDLIKRELAKWRDVVKRSGAKFD